MSINDEISRLNFEDFLWFIFALLCFLNRVSGSQKALYRIKLLGSSLLLAGVICLIYFQVNNNSFIGSPAL